MSVIWKLPGNDRIDTDYDYLFKILILGDSAVGKSSLLIRFADKGFSDSHKTTIGVDFRINTLEVEDKIVKLQLWDTAGCERYSTLSPNFFRNTDGALIVYDITNRESFVRIQRWLEALDRYGRPGMCKVLVGNKSDLEADRAVDYIAGKMFAEKLGTMFLETSAKQDVNVEQAFITMTSEIKRRVDTGLELGAPKAAASLTLKESTAVGQTWCCSWY